MLIISGIFLFCVLCTDLFQQWHQEKNINLDKLEEAHQTKMMQTRRFIRLADENSSGCAESDEPEYDSYNEHETGTVTVWSLCDIVIKISVNVDIAMR